MNQEPTYQFSGQTNFYRGKVRDVYTIGQDLLVMVASNRISAFDVVLPEGQQILVRDWRAKALFGLREALAPAASLVDGEFITSEGLMTMVLYELQFDAPHVVYVDGLELGAGVQ